MFQTTKFKQASHCSYKDSNRKFLKKQTKKPLRIKKGGGRFIGVKKIRGIFLVILSKSTIILIGRDKVLNFVIRRILAFYKFSIFFFHNNKIKMSKCTKH